MRRQGHGACSHQGKRVSLGKSQRGHAPDCCCFPKWARPAACPLLQPLGLPREQLTASPVCFFFIALVQTKCQAEASFGGVHPGRFRPECDENGDYLPKQCHASTGYCWCCYKNGTRIEGTATRGELDCSGRWRGEQRAQLTVRERQPGREGEHGAGTRPLHSWCPGS